MLPETSRRVPANTDADVNRRIQRDMEQRIAWYAEHPERIDSRLAELDEEWDIERTLEANAATIALGGVILSLLRGRQWLILPGVVGGFLLQHALQGWCPPVPVFRRLGIRTQREIDEERFALKALRGDLEDLPQRKSTGTGTHQLIEAIQR